jgi:aminopeptidase N
MYSPQTGDDDFKAMMKDFISSHYNKDVSTEDFKRFVDKHMQKGMDLGGNGRMDWFFDQWVYGTEMPTYALEYSLREEGGRTVLAAKLTQSGVSDGFRMQVPIYLDFGKGWSRLGQVALVGNASKEFTVPLPQRPKRVAANALNDVLCLSTTNTGR